MAHNQQQMRRCVDLSHCFPEPWLSCQPAHPESCLLLSGCGCKALRSPSAKQGWKPAPCSILYIFHAPHLLNFGTPGPFSANCAHHVGNKPHLPPSYVLFSNGSSLYSLIAYFSSPIRLFVIVKTKCPSLSIITLKIY